MKLEKAMATTPFSFRIDEKLKTKLEKAAAREQRSASHVVHQAVTAYLDRQDAKRKAIREAMAEAEKGVFISEEAMDAWIDSWGTERELPPPEPDIFPPAKKTA
jgi:predicted transcriptional regulator